MVAPRLLKELTLFALCQVAGLQPASVRRRLALLAELKDRDERVSCRRNTDREFDDSIATLAGAHVVRAPPGRWLQYFPGDDRYCHR